MPVEDRHQKIRKLYEDHHREILAYCARRVGFDEADDITSEVFTVAWRRSDEITMETARAWLYGVARGVVANQQRSLFRRRRLQDRLADLPQDSEVPSDWYLAQSSANEVVHSALRRLRRLDREVLMLAAWEELSAPEIARALDISVSAAEQRLHRAKRRLARVLPPVSPGVSSRVAAENGGG